MYPQALAYLGVRTGNLSDWTTYGTGLIGLQLVERSRNSVAFRADDRKQRIIVDQDGGSGVKFFGWEVSDSAALDALASRLDGAGARVEQGTRALAEERAVADLVWLEDPVGNRVELCWGAMTTTDPFVPGRSLSGFRTGTLGLGHVVMNVENLQPVAAFYRDLLGFRVSDYYSHPFPAMFFHINARHHSLAFVQGARNAVHHLMLEHFSFDDVGQGYDLAMMDPERLAVTLGRHCGDYMTSFYTRTPSDFMVEHGWGGRVIDPATWQAAERNEGPSLWGHERTWLSQELRDKALQQRLANAANGLRRPVQVLEGNFTQMPGICPWWDGLRETHTRGAVADTGAVNAAIIDAVDLE